MPPVTPQPQDQADLDLDYIQPEAKHVKLNGKLLEVYPPKLKNIVVISKMARELSDETKTIEEKVQVFESLKQVLAGIMPAFKEDDVDVTLEQMIALIEFIFSLATPEDKEELAKLNATPADQADAEKKTE